MFVDNHDFDVTITLLLLGDDGDRLVFADVEEVVELLLACCGEGGVHFVGDHFVCTALLWEEFTLWLSVLSNLK